MEPRSLAVEAQSTNHWLQGNSLESVLILCFLSESSLYSHWISPYFFVFILICPVKLSRGNTKGFTISQQLDLAIWPSTRTINSVWQQSEFSSFSYAYTISKTNVNLKLVILSVWHLFHEGGAYLEIITKFNFSHSKTIYIRISCC